VSDVEVPGFAAGMSLARLVVELVDDLTTTITVAAASRWPEQPSDPPLARALAMRCIARSLAREAAALSVGADELDPP
jgi:hypothetical protein